MDVFLYRIKYVGSSQLFDAFSCRSLWVVCIKCTCLLNVIFSIHFDFQNLLIEAVTFKWSIAEKHMTSVELDMKVNSHFRLWMIIVGDIRFLFIPLIILYIDLSMTFTVISCCTIGFLFCICLKNCSVISLVCGFLCITKVLNHIYEVIWLVFLLQGIGYSNREGVITWGSQKYLYILFLLLSVTVCIYQIYFW